MRNLLMVTAILPLLGSAALAQGTRAGRDINTAVGPMAWPGAAAKWAALSDAGPNDARPVLDSKTKHLIGLAVAARIPCGECLDAHIKAARANGATDGEILEVMAMTSLPLH